MLWYLYMHSNWLIVQVTCNVRGKLDPPCNAVGYVDRKVLGINHMYQHPAWKRSKVCRAVFECKSSYQSLCTLFASALRPSETFHGNSVLQACTYSSPHEGPFRDDAPAWCVAPFEPEGILRYVSLVHFNLRTGTSFS